MRYYQCRLEQETPDGIVVEVAHIEEKGAKVNALVELIGIDGLWRVKTVSNNPVDSKKLREKQSIDRKSLLSIVRSEK